MKPSNKRKNIYLFLFVYGLIFLPNAAAANPLLNYSNVTVDEGSSAANITVHITSPSDSIVRFSWSTRYGSAISGSDYKSKSGRVTIFPGDISASFSVDIVDDEIDEPTQFFNVYFRNGSGVSISADPVPLRVFIEDNDPEPTIKFQKDLLQVTEGTSSEPNTAYVAVKLSHRSEKNIRFTAHTAWNTASTLEFEYKAERVLFDSRGVVYKYPVNIIADADLEGRQQFYIYMRNPSNAILDLSGSTLDRTDRIRTKIQIIDDDYLSSNVQIDNSSGFHLVERSPMSNWKALQIILA